MAPPSKTKTTPVQSQSPIKRKQMSAGSHSQPKSPFKSKPSPTGSQVRATRSSQFKEVDTKDVPSSQPKSPGQDQFTCKGCGKEVEKLRSHLKRTKDCQDCYDMDALEEEAKRLHREQMAARNRELYQKKRTPEKEAAPPEFKCPICEVEFFYKKTMDRHIAKQHSQIPTTFTCDICEKVFEYRDNLNRHMTEVHGGSKHKCDKCPAAFTRNSELQKHIDADWHYLEFKCGVCSKNLVFKSLAGLIRHIIVKRNEEQTEHPHPDYKGKMVVWKKSGILMTCRSGEGSIEVEEGQHIYFLSKEEIGEADKKRMKEKEEYINSGLSAAYGNRENPSVKLEFIKKKHTDNSHKYYCMSCGEKKPYADENCKFRYVENWHLNMQ